MSASLVGSEMCIRDRQLVHCCPWQQAQAQTPFRPTRVASAGGQNRCQPVSYTHLTLPTICSV
eukprot:14137690-Alexandrium_andersonii.AAC.1